jgi:hypothetical protein
MLTFELLRKTWRVLPIAFCLSMVACDGEEETCPPAGMSNCDPVEARCCPEGQGCMLYYSPVGRFVDACFGGVGEASLGSTCQPNASSGANACEPGSTCLMTGSDTGPVCHLICYDSSDCNGGSCSVELPGVAVRGCE